MSKGRKRAKAQKAAKAAKFRMPSGPRPPPPGGFCGGGPPKPPFGPPMSAGHFRMRPPDFGPPMMVGGQFRNEPPEFLRREQYEHGPRFEMPPRFHHPHVGDEPRGFRPDPYEDRPGFHQVETEGRPLGFVPPEFRDRPPGFVPPEFRDRTSGFTPPDLRDGPPRFVPPGPRDGPPRFVPPDLRGSPPRFVPPAHRDGPPRFVPPELRDGPLISAPVAGIRPSRFVPGPGLMMTPDRGPLDVGSAAAPVAPCPPHRTPEPTQQSSGPANNGNSQNSTTTTTETSTPNKETTLVKRMLGSVKPPPGRSLGVITFISSSYGFIEREDLKKYSFSFDGFFGKRIHLVPGVKVHFTAVKGSKKKFATDVKVAPGGTEEIEPTVYEGVVTAVLPETYVLEAYPGRIRSILTTETVKLPFGKMDSKATLLLFDQVKFQLCTDIITKVRRATNITPQMPETFQLTKETREKGVIMNIKDDTCTIMSKIHESLTAHLSEYLSDEQLKIMDEVEFTVVTIKDVTKAIRLKTLPEGSVEFESQSSKVTDHSACKSMWKPVISKDATVHEDISSEKYEGTISKIIPRSSTNEMGLVNMTVADVQKSLPFGAGDMITTATMMVADKVQFNVATNQQTKAERAVNIEIQPETFVQESTEQRKIGTVIKLDDNCGFIKTQQDPQLVFDLSEVMDDAKLTLSEKVEFTLAVGADESAEGKQAIRVRRLTESVFTSVPKIEEKKEKKKMTIKLLTDPKDLIQNIKTEPAETVCSEKLASKEEASKTPKQDNKNNKENLTKGSRERSRSRENARHRSSRSSSRSQDGNSSHHCKRRSTSRDRSYRSNRRSRSHSRDRSRTYRRRYSHSRSRSKSSEKSSRGGRKRSRSPDRRQPTTKERRSPDGQNKMSKYAASSVDMTSPSTQDVNNELEKKRKELLALNELIARRKAIIAMEQNTKMTSQFKDVLERDGQQGIATYDYQHKPCLENSWTPDMKPVRSILKKHSESLTGPQPQTTERTDSVEEPEGCPEPSGSSIYMSADSVPVWVKHSSTPEVENQKLAMKKRQLEELSESIARKRAIIAMEQKAKVHCDESKIKKEYDFAPCSDVLDITMTNKNIWQLDIKPDLQPKKSILKKSSESVTDQLQRDLPSAGQYALFPMSKQPKDNKSACLNPSEPSFKKPCNQPSVILNTVDLFKKLINQASTSSCTSKQSFQPSTNSYYDPKNARVSQDLSYSTSPSQISQFSHQDCETASTSEGSSALKQKTNLATQMQRFLGALNKADSNLLSLLKDARKDSDLLAGQRITQAQAERKVSAGDELYDPFKEIDCTEDCYPVLGQIENTQDNLLPHEIAVVDGSGFSKIVGMKYGIEAKPENRSLYNEAIPSSSHGRHLEEYENFLKECDASKLSRDRYSAEPFYDNSEYVEDRDRNQRQKTSDRHRVESRLGSAQQKLEGGNEDVDQKTSQYNTIQDLLQTIGLNLDTTEVRKLADRTNERLYGKKIKPQRAPSFDQKDERSLSRYDRRGSSHSTDSEGVRSVSPVKTSKREVYMSYFDSVKRRHNEAAGEEQEMFTLKRTIRNSPKAKEMSPEPYNTAPPEATNDSYNPAAETFSQVPQAVGLQYTQISSEYAVGGDQNPYVPVPVNLLNYPTSYAILPPQFPSGYGNYPASAGIMPPSPLPYYPAMSPFTTSGVFGPSSPSTYPATSGQFGFSMQSGRSGYATQQTKTKPAALNRCLKTIQTVQTQNSLSVKVSGAEDVRTVISIETQKDPKYTEGEAESQVTHVTEDDIKAKQKKRLEQFNQRMRLKKEQQMEAQRTRRPSQKSAPGKVMQTEVKNVWICGHSLVFWAEKRATSPEIGMQLGMDPNSIQVWWKGVQGMTWHQLLPQLLQLKDNWPKPDVIIIHLGGNDLGKLTPENFVLAVKKDMNSLKSIFPQCHLVWSDILPRKSWRHLDDSTTVNNMRHTVNKTIHDIMAKIGGSSLTHDNIMPGVDSGLYRPDGVHLSGKGIDTFNLNMQDFLEKWECETETPES